MGEPVGIAHIRALIGVTLAALSFAAGVQAHEIGTTQVHAIFRKDHTFTIGVITAPQALVNKLEAQAHQARSTALTTPQLQERLQAFAPRLAGAASIRFGSISVAPRITILPIVAPADPRQASYVVVRFSGDIPPRASDFTWQYALTYAAYALALQNEGHGAPVRQWLEGDQRSGPFSLARDILPPTRLEVMHQYLKLGFTHIVPHGLDHILFVLGIFLLTTKIRSILAQVTAFTIAHSITLGLTIYGLVSLSPRIVEPMIALSIVYVALENLVTSELKPWRVAIVFAFGLLHGMGFAGVLKEMGLPRSEFLTALVMFNVGVELGQLTVIAAAFCLVAYWHQKKPWYRHRFVVPASIAIATVGVFWTVQRLALLKS
ncbi:MAG: HupE/UreJ family protein [Acidobacteriota bacterium]|nr:HupE/UreJ family protein [Acidobacteriota bacterium]